MKDLDEETLLELGKAEFVLKEQQDENTMWRNIFGGKIDNKPVSYIDTDDFFIDLYNYYYNGGFFTIIITQITEILSLIFGIFFTIFIFILLDWNKILQCGNNNEIKDCGELNIYINFHFPNFFCILILMFASVFTICKIFLFFYNYRNLDYIHRFYTNNLKINSKKLQTMSWAEVIHEISSNQKINLSIYEITSRIMRKDNFFISLIHKDIIRINNYFYTKQLEINLKYILLSDIEKLNSSSLKRKFIIYGLGNLLISVFVFIYLFSHFFAINIEEFYSNKNLGSRKYSLLTKWKFRDYNELEHFFERRINKSIKYSNEYLKQFPSPVTEVICKFICLISGAFIGFLLILSILDESILLYVRLFDRSLIFYTGILGAISATCRNFLKIQENNVYDASNYMKKIYKYTHYMPVHWTNKLNTYDIRDEFISMFPYTILIFIFDLISVITTPLILIFIMPNHVSEIVSFIKINSVENKNIGKICGFSILCDETKINDRKMKKSLSGFVENNSVKNNKKDDEDEEEKLIDHLEAIIEDDNSIMYSRFI